MSRQLLWLDYARDDLDAIHHYYSLESSAGIASKLLMRIIESAELLIAHPQIGHPCEDHEILEWHVPNTDYTLPYIVTPEHIQILRVFHEKQMRPSSWEAD